MCPIQGLTDRQKAFFRVARIKKGEKDQDGKMRDLDYFRLVFSDGCQEIEKAFREVYGEKPTRINIRLAYPTVDEVWDAFYVAYETGGLLAKAGSGKDGAYWVWYRDHDTKEILVRDGRPVGPNGARFMEKPCDLSAPVYSYLNRKNEKVDVFMEPEGRLNLVVPEVARVGNAYVVGFFEFCPTSPRDIGTISSELASISAWAKNVGKDLTGIPMVLTRRKEMVTKNIKGVLSRGPSWVVHIELGGDWGRKAIEAMQMKALPEIIDAEVEDIIVQESEFVDEDGQPESQKEIPVITVPAPAPAPAPVTEPEEPPAPPEQIATEATRKPEATSAPKRPYAPADFKTALKDLISKVEASYAKDEVQLIATDNERKVLASVLDSVFGDKSMSRSIVCSNLFGGAGSTKDLSAAQVKALFLVMGIRNTPQHPANYNDPPSAESIAELRQVLAEIESR